MLLVGDTAADFNYGMHYLIKGGTFTSWTKVWISAVDNTTPLYESMQVQAATAIPFDDIYIPTDTFDHIRIGHVPYDGLHLIETLHRVPESPGEIESHNALASQGEWFHMLAAQTGCSSCNKYSHQNRFVSFKIFNIFIHRIYLKVYEENENIVYRSTGLR